MLKQGMLKIAHRLSQAARRAGAAPLLQAPVVTRIRRCLFVVRAEDVLEILEVLETDGVRAWVAGGWGVDALLGSETRPHHDLDLVVSDGDDSLARALDSLAGLGIDDLIEGTVGSGLLPSTVQLRDERGRIVDLLPANLERLSRGRVTMPDGGGASPFATGRIAGQPVPCLSAGVQLALHEGFEMFGYQRRDMHALCRQYAFPVPTSEA